MLNCHAPLYRIVDFALPLFLLFDQATTKKRRKSKLKETNRRRNFRCCLLLLENKENFLNESQFD